MAIIKKINNFLPKIGKNCFLAENSVLVGDVILKENCSVWYNAVLRGDVNFIRIGHSVNIQDNVVIHGTYQINPTIIGNKVSIGHGSIIHGCTISDNVLVGMGSIIMDGVCIGSNTIIGAGTLVPKNKIIQPNSILVGNPFKVIKENVSLNDLKIIEETSLNYIKYAKWYKEN